jgi:polysaccharide biosynthesis transport protein
MLPLADLAAAIRQRYRIELAVFLIVLLASIASIVLATRVYTSTASLLFDEAPIDPAKGEESGGGNLSSLLTTQADVLQSNLVAARVAKDLNLVTPELLSQWRNQTGGTGDVALWAGGRLLNGLEVIPDKASRVLRVRYRSADGNYSATMANAFVRAYLDQNLELQTDPAKTYSRWYVDRTREVRATLEKAQAKLTEFRRRTGIVDNDDTNAEASRLTELQTAVTSAEVGTAELGSRSANAVTQSPDVQNSAVVAGLRASIAAKSAQVSELSVALGPNHPDRKAAEAELTALNAKLGAAVAQQSKAVQTASSAARTKEAELRRSLETQKARMLRLAGDRAEYDVLRRDVDSARAAYDQVTQRLDAMRLSAVAPAGGVRQLDVARASMIPSEPKVGLRILLGAVLGTILAIGVAIFLEFVRPVVRSARSLQHTTGLPVLATIDFTKSQAFGRLNADKKAA